MKIERATSDFWDRLKQKAISPNRHQSLCKSRSQKCFLDSLSSHLTGNWCVNACRPVRDFRQRHLNGCVTFISLISWYSTSISRITPGGAPGYDSPPVHDCDLGSKTRVMNLGIFKKNVPNFGFLLFLTICQIVFQLSQ